MSGLELALLATAAIVGGAVNALAGGGTLITFPALLAVGVPAVAANITNTVATCPGYLGGALAQAKEVTGERRRLREFSLVSALGGLLGGVLLLNTGEERFRVLIPYLILLAAGLLAIEGPVHRWRERRIGRREDRHAHAALQALPIFLASIYGGYFGGGLSVMVLAALAWASNDSLTRLNALKQVVSLCTNAAAAAFFLFTGKIVWSATIVMAVAALAGGAVGGLFADRIRPSVLRGIVVAFGVAIAIAYFVE